MASSPEAIRSRSYQLIEYMEMPSKRGTLKGLAQGIREIYRRSLDARDLEWLHRTTKETEAIETKRPAMFVIDFVSRDCPPARNGE
jgi:hypothetical protein